jgi:hypothetical protein
MVGVLGDQHLGDQSLGGDATLDDPRRGWRLNDRTLARAATIARAARNQNAEGCRHHVETLSHVLADLVERAAAAGAGSIIHVDNLLDPLEMRRQCTAVSLARPFAASLRDYRLACSTRLTERCLDILETELKLVWVKLLRLASEPVPHERINDRLKPLNLCVGLALGESKIGPYRAFFCECAGLLKDKRAKRFDIVGKVRFHEHGRSESAVRSSVNRQSAAR